MGISFRYHYFGEQNGNKRDLAELSKEMHVRERKRFVKPEIKSLLTGL